jgi:integrase
VTVIRDQVAALKAAAGAGWHEHGLVFPTKAGTEETKLCRSSRGIRSAGSRPVAAVTFRMARRTFAASALMSDAGVPLEKIAQLVGHSGTTVTEEVYRKQIRPVITDGAETVDRLFPVSPRSASAKEADQED